MPAWDNGQGWVFLPAGARAPAQPTIKTGWSKKPGPEHINTTTGTATLVRTIRSHGVNDLAWSNDGATLYFAAGNRLYTYNPDTYAIRRIDTFQRRIEALEMGPAGVKTDRDL